MTVTLLNENELAALRQLDTPTVCNALEITSPERRGSHFTVSPLFCAFPDLPPIVGYARTGTMRARMPHGVAPAEARARRNAYYDYVGGGDAPKIAIIQDLDPAPGFGALWGEVNSAIHKGLGCGGVVTNGSIRDLDAIAPDFQLLAGVVGPSHAWVAVTGFGEPVNVAGMAVADGDLVHADRHGAVVIPHDVARDIPAAAALIARREAVILEAARQTGFDAQRLAAAMGESDEIH